MITLNRKGGITIYNFKALFRQYRIPLGILTLYYITANYFFGYFCPSQVMVGLPCPGCGLTRAGKLLLTGHIREAAAMNPMIIVAAPLLALAAAVKIKKPDLLRFLYYPVLITLLLSFGVFYYRITNHFGVEPMVINDRSIFHRILSYMLTKQG